MGIARNQTNIAALQVNLVFACGAALCFARIAKAILGGITSHYEQFPIP